LAHKLDNLQPVFPVQKQNPFGSSGLSVSSGSLVFSEGSSPPIITVKLESLIIAGPVRMTKTIEQIRSLLLSAVDLSREANCRLLTHIVEIALAELSELSQKSAPEKISHRTLISVSEDRSPDVIGGWNWDIANKVVYADPDVALIYNVTPDAAERGIPQNEFGAAIHSDDMPKVAHAVTHTLSEGGGFSVVYKLVQADGSLKAVLAVGRAVFKNGVPVNFKGTIIDVTDDDARREPGMKYRISEASPHRARG
jgi:PAS domain-containing protein